MKKSEYKSYDDLPLFLNLTLKSTGEAQRSGFGLERRSNKMSAF